MNKYESSLCGNAYWTLSHVLEKITETLTRQSVLTITETSTRQSVLTITETLTRQAVLTITETLTRQAVLTITETLTRQSVPTSCFQFALLLSQRSNFTHDNFVRYVDGNNELKKSGDVSVCKRDELIPRIRSRIQRQYSFGLTLAVHSSEAVKLRPNSVSLCSAEGNITSDNHHYYMIIFKKASSL